MVQPINYGAMALQPLMSGFQNALEMARLGQQGRQFGQQQELAQQRMAQQEEQFAAQQAAAAQRQAQQQSQFEQNLALQQQRIDQQQAQFEAQQQQTQQQTQAVAAQREEAARLYREGTPDEIAEFTLNNPEIGQQLEQRIGYKNDNTKRLMADTLGAALATNDPTQRQKIINDGAAKIKAAGGNPENLLASVGDDPEQFEKGAILALGSTGEYGKGYLNAYAGIEKKEEKREAVKQKVEAEKKENQKTYNAYKVGMLNLEKALEKTTTGPVAGRAPALTTEQQTAEGAIASMAPVLKQLFRSAGEGAFTDYDQKLLLDMMPTRADTPQARKQKIQNINEIVEAKLGMRELPSWYVPEEEAMAQQPGQPQPTAEEQARRAQTGQPAQQQYTEGQTATNPQTGERLVFRGGQWQTM